MIIEISITVIAITLILCCIFIAIAVCKIQKILESAKKEMQRIGSEAIKLIIKTEGLISDLQSKADSLDTLFQPLKSIQKLKFHKNGTGETLSEIIEWVGSSLSLFTKIKNVVKKREK
ncbi:MAG TPA: hypothetical protein VLE95_08405 [Chlamydiales bacterium]|nr:hypothetical protein [Chlamydiales bacterium]